MKTAVLFSAFADEFSKVAGAPGLGSHAAELAGLGILAVPHAYNAVTGKKTSHKTERNAELTGLGVLAAPSLKAVGQHLLKRGSAEKVSGAFDKALHMADAGRVAVSQAAHTAVKKPQFTLDHLRKAYQSAGMKPGLGSAARAMPKV